MFQTAVFVLLAGLGLEVFALRNPENAALKVAATLASVCYLVSFCIYRPPGSFASVWPMGMNIYCMAQRCWNYLWLKQSWEFHRVGEQQIENNRATSSARDPMVEEPRKEKDDAKKATILIADIPGGAGSKRSSSTACHSFADALDIALTFRGVGWSFEAKGLPKVGSVGNSRVTFAYSQLKGAFCQFIVLDFMVAYANATYASVDRVSLLTKLALGGVMLLYVRWTMDIPYRICSAMAVLSGITKPTAWPPLFGAWQESYTIRRFWSHTWHQGMRLLAEAPTGHIVHSWLHLPRGSYASKWCRFCGNFLIAAFDHAYGRIIAGGNPKHDWVFFAIQPAAIWVEETARNAAVECGLLDAKERSPAELWLGYVWTGLFECWTFLHFMEGAIRVQGGVPATSLIETPFGVSLFAQVLH